MSAGPCPDENMLSAWAGGHASPEDMGALTSHVESCNTCREAFAAIAGDPDTGGSTVLSPKQRLHPASSPIGAGDVLAGKYEVTEIVGMGGMGVVVKAKHLQLNTNVALKLIRSEMLGDSDASDRFAREARAASRLKSAHANRVLDFEHLPNGMPYMVMEFLEGETLEARRHRSPSLSEAEVARLMRQAVSALKEAHGLGIVHRDLKPSNLFLRREPNGTDTLVVLDFGVAKSVNPDIEHGLGQTTAGGVVGSPAFMAPEQLTSGAPLDARTDIWAIGCTMHTLLSGALPFKGRDLIDLAWSIRNTSPAELPPRVSSVMRACIEKCLQRAPERRFQNADELDTALADVEARAPGRREKRTAMAFTVGLGVLLAFITGWALLGKPEVPPAPAPAPQPSVEVEVVTTPALPEAPTPAAPAVKAAEAKSRPPKPAKPVDAGIDDVFGARY